MFFASVVQSIPCSRFPFDVLSSLLLFCLVFYCTQQSEKEGLRSVEVSSSRTANSSLSGVCEDPFLYLHFSVLVCNCIK